MDEDLELLERWCAGDKAAGSVLFGRHFADIYRFFERKVAGDPEELVQETFLACVRRRDEFRRQSSFRTFLFAVARFELYAHWRRLARQGQAIDFSKISLADLVTTPGARIARGQDRERLLAALQTLSQKPPAAASASASAEPLETVGTRLARARRELLRQLQSPGHRTCARASKRPRTSMSI